MPHPKVVWESWDVVEAKVVKYEALLKIRAWLQPLVKGNETILHHHTIMIL